MPSFEEAKTLISEFNKKVQEFNNLKAELAKNIANDFSKVIEGYLTEYKIPFVFIKGTKPWMDGDDTYFTFNADYGFEEIEYSIETLQEFFPKADFSNIKEDIPDTRKLVSALKELADLTEEAFGEAWHIHAAYDVAGNFHYDFGECNDDY